MYTRENNTVTPRNGAFLDNLANISHNSRIQDEVDRVMYWLFDDGQLTRTFDDIRGSFGPDTAFSEQWEGRGLRAFSDGNNLVTDRFSDSTNAVSSDGIYERSIDNYTALSSSTQNEIFPNRELKSVEVKTAELAVAVFDPELLEIDEPKRLELFGEVSHALRAYIGGVRPEPYSTSLLNVARDCMVGHGFTEESDEYGNAKKWRLPFDEIAWLKGLVVLLGDELEDHSGFVRQGAVLVADEASGKRVIVACSGQDSRFDEMAAEVIGKRIVSGGLVESKDQAKERLLKRLAIINRLAYFAVITGELMRAKELNDLAGYLITRILNADNINSQPNQPDKEIESYGEIDIFGSSENIESAKKLAEGVVVNKDDFVMFISVANPNYSENTAKGLAGKMWAHLMGFGIARVRDRGQYESFSDEAKQIIESLKFINDQEQEIECDQLNLVQGIDLPSIIDFISSIMVLVRKKSIDWPLELELVSSTKPHRQFELGTYKLFVNFLKYILAKQPTV